MRNWIITYVHVLALPDLQHTFEIETNDLYYDVGIVLTQHGHLVTMDSNDRKWYYPRNEIHNNLPHVFRFKYQPHVTSEGVKLRHLTDTSSSIREIMEIQHWPNFWMRYYFYQMSLLHRLQDCFSGIMFGQRVGFYCIFLCNAFFSQRSILSLLK